MRARRAQLPGITVEQYYITKLSDENSIKIHANSPVNNTLRLNQ